MFRLPPLSSVTRQDFCRLLFPVWILLAGALSGNSASAQTLLDNTNGATAGAAVSAVILTNTMYAAYGLQVGATGYDLNGLTILARTGGIPRSAAVTVDLYEADVALKPVGTPIKSFATSVLVDGGTAAYRDIDLTGQGFQLAANTRYALGLRGDAPGVHWSSVNPKTLPTGSAGITTTGVYYSSFSGASWSLLSPDTSTPAFWLRGVESSGAPAVPEPGAVALFLPALAAILLVRRRERTSRKDPN